MGFKLENTVSKKSITSIDKGGATDILKKEIPLFSPSFSNKKKENFYTEISVLLHAGINLKDALSLLRDNQKKEKQQFFYSEMVNALVSGKAFSEVIRAKKEFSEYEYHSLKIGEETGTTAKIAKELGKFFGRKNEQRRNLLNALTYPIIILITAILVVVFMLRLVVPMFQDIFKQNNVELPGITEFIIAASDFIKDYGYYVILFIIGLGVLRKIYGDNELFKKKKGYLQLKIPYIGNFIKAVYMAQFTQAVTLLTASKVPVLNSIELVRQMIDFFSIERSIGKC